MKILVVEDSKVVAKLVISMLEGSGHEVVLAENGEQAFQLISSGEKFDVTLLDWNMPIMNGMEFLTSITDTKENCGKIIMMTTESSFEKMNEALKKGVDEYIMKPFDEVILFEKINLVMDEAA